MGSPAEKPDPNPIKGVEGARQSDPAPKTREEAGQYAVDARYHELEKITDPQQRERAESLIRSSAEQDFAATGKAVERLKASQARWEQKLNSMSEKNPVRIAGQRVYNAVQRRQHAQIGATVLKSARKQADILTRAQKASAAYRQHQQSQPAKDNERER